MIVHRVRSIDIDGNKLGKVWTEKFFMQKEEAEKYLIQEVDFGNREEIRYKLDTVEGVEGYCNWWNGIMICYDQIVIGETMTDKPKNKIENKTVRINGKVFYCECGCNVFNHPKPDDKLVYECNACGAWYRGAK